MFVYLARPIDQAAESSWLDTLTNDIQAKLALVGIGAFRPHLAFLANIHDPQHLEYVDGINRMAQFAADATLAILPAGMATLGVPAEIETSLSLNRPTVILSDIWGSVQLAQWSRRGATVINLNTDGASAEHLNKALLTPPSDEGGSEPDHMLVKYDLGALPLTKAHPGDAGFDVATLEDVTLHYGERTLLRTGVRAVVPEGWYGRLTGRSSAATRWQVDVHEGVIDAGYTGELKIAVTYKGGGGSVVVPAGTRLGQYILGPVWDGELVMVKELPATLRGEKGFGSSGI